MGQSPVMNPYGGPLPLVDKMLGSAYGVVRYVAQNLGPIMQIAQNLPTLLVLANNMTTAFNPPNNSTLTLAFTTYAPDTTLPAPQGFVLGAIANFAEGSFIEIYDAMGNAENNPIQITPLGTDTIVDHGTVITSGQTHFISNSNTITRYTVRNGAWRVTQYGG